MVETVIMPRADWQAALDATRAKGGTSALLTSSQLGPTIEAIPTGGGGSGAPNGTDWSQSSIGSETCYAVGYFKGKWYCGLSSGLKSSADFINWKTSSTLLCSSLAQIGGYLVAGTAKNGIQYTTDGVSWTSSNVSSGQCRNITVYDDFAVTWVKNVGLKWSSDGETWADCVGPIFGPVPKILRGKSVWIATGDKGVYKSDDGKTWSATNVTVPIVDAIYADGVFVVSDKEELWWSEDGANWTRTRYSPSWFSTGFSGLCYAKGIWLATTSDGIAHSADGKNWVEPDVFSSDRGEGDSLFFSSGVFISYTHGGGTKMCSSLDGKSWARIKGTPAPAVKQTLVRNGNICAGTSGHGIWYSPVWKPTA